jgi:glycosyltransferase involved in cell wall biosynthesis
LKIVVLASRFPYPLEKGDKLRLFHQIKLLAEHHEVHLLSITDKKPKESQIHKLAEFCTTIEYYKLPVRRRLFAVLTGWIKGLPAHVSYFYNAGIRKKIYAHVNSLAPDLVFCQLVRMMPYTSDLKGVKWIDLMDSYSLNLRRRTEKSGWLDRLWLKPEVKRMELMERKALEQFDLVSIISEQDRDSILSPLKDKIEILSNGVDLTYFAWNKNEIKEYDVAFAGNLGYEPNVNAVLVLFDIYRNSLSEYRFIIAGARPSRKITVLNDERFVVKGWMEDIRDVYYQARIFVAPLFTGSGQQNKILEAMACGIPVITTSLVNSAIGAVPGESVLLADSPDEFESQINYLLNHPEVAERIAYNALQLVKCKYSWHHIGLQLERFLTQTV